MDVADIARELSIARQSGVAIEPPSRRHRGFSIDDGYAVGQLLHAERLASGDKTVGLKLGFTNQAVWKNMGLDSPFWSPVYESTVLEPGAVSIAGLVAARIEPEIVVGFRSDLEPNATDAELVEAIGWAALGFEIVQCHYPDWQMAPADAIADAGLHGLLVVGDHVEVAPLEVSRLSEVVVALSREGDQVAAGRGASALGGPADAIKWLRRLPGVGTLNRGVLVTTGTLTPAFPVGAGETWELSASGPVPFGHVAVRLT
jgi:2-oxo-3-hexenedioate decarboxylase